MEDASLSQLFEQRPKALSAQWHLDPRTGFLLREVYGSTERFVYHTHDYYELFLIVSGRILHCVNRTVQRLEAGCLVFVRPSDVHHYLYDGTEEYRHINLALSRELVETMFSYLGDTFDRASLLECPCPPVMRLSEFETARLVKKLQHLHTIDNRDVLEQKLSIRRFLLSLFCDYYVSVDRPGGKGIPPWLEEVCEQMKKTENFTVGIERMVCLSGKSQEHLARCMRRYLDTTLSQFVNELRIRYAANLLCHTNLSVTEVCYEAGFGNVSRFYDVFAQCYGTSPRRFRMDETMEEK